MTTAPSTNRRRRILAIGLPILALLVIAAIVIPRLYAASVNAGAAPAPTLEPPVASPTSPGPTDPGPSREGSPSRAATDDALAGTWQVTDGSFAGYRVNEVLNGAAVTVTGRTEQVTGSLTVESARLTRAKITVDMASVTTDSNQRDNYFRRTALRTDTHPEATFTLSEPVDISGLATGEKVSVTAKGELTIAGTTRPVSVPLQAARTGTTMQVVGSIAITFADFGVQAPNLGFVQVEPRGSVEFSLRLTD